MANNTIGRNRTSDTTRVLNDQEARAEVEAALAREYRFQAAVSQTLASDAPEQGLAEVLHGHLGLAVAVEDPFGRVLARAGADDAAYPRLTRSQRERLVDAGRRNSGPLRIRDRLASLATSRGTVLGVIVVLDPEATLEPSDRKDPDSDAAPGSPRAGALHAIGLATGALTLHLLHRRHLARTELRLRHDLVETVLLEPGLDRPAGRDRPPRRARLGPEPRPDRPPPGAGPAPP